MPMLLIRDRQTQIPKIAPQMSIPTVAMDFPLQHPPLMMRDLQVERFIQDICFDYFPKLPKRIRLKLNRILNQKLGSRSLFS